MIQSFKSDFEKAIFEGETPRGTSVAIAKAARRRLFQLNAAVELNDLGTPPGNRLHPLVADRAGQHAIWINDQYRICFVWTDNGPANVEITDYHS